MYKGVYPIGLNGSTEETVIETSNLDELNLINLPHVQAVIHSSNGFPTWLVELAEAVKTGAFQVLN